MEKTMVLPAISSTQQIEKYDQAILTLKETCEKIYTGYY